MKGPSTRLLISHIIVRGRELQQIYSTLAAHAFLTEQELQEAFVTPPDVEQDPFAFNAATFRETLNFLLIIRMVKKQETNHQTVYSASPARQSLPFSLLLLHHLTTHPDERQQALAHVYRHLIRQDALSLTLGEVREKLECVVQPFAFAWTDEKIAFWAQLAQYVGIIYRLERDYRLLVAPTPTLLLLAIKQAMKQQQTEYANVAACLQFIDEQYFACFTDQHTVHSGITQTIKVLHGQGKIILTHQADAAHSLLLQDWRISTIQLPPEGAVE